MAITQQDTKIPKVEDIDFSKLTSVAKTTERYQFIGVMYDKRTDNIEFITDLDVTQIQGLTLTGYLENVIENELKVVVDIETLICKPFMRKMVSRDRHSHKNRVCDIIWEFK
jgi:hypothetical protein